MAFIPFIERIGPASKAGGFRQNGFWIWCGSPIHADEDGRYHLFASRWPKTTAFSPFFLTESEIVRAACDKPEGPYQFEEVVLPGRGSAFWDGMMTHNPTIHRCPLTGTYLLYYSGTTFPPDALRSGTFHDGAFAIARQNLRTGLAISPSIFGPWTRGDQPVITPRPGRWDAMQNSNPAACVLGDGTVYLAYKGIEHPHSQFHYGMTRARSFHGPYESLSDEPIFRFGGENHVEDAYLWREDGQFQMIMKDMSGGLSGERHAGIHATSQDAVCWTLSHPPQAWSRVVRWDDGTTTTQGSFERPQLLFEGGRPTHLFAATGDGPGGFWNAQNTWNMVIPLRA